MLTSSQKNYLRIFGYITAATSAIWLFEELFKPVHDNMVKIGAMEYRLKGYSKALAKIEDELEKIQDDLELKK